MHVPRPCQDCAKSWQRFSDGKDWKGRRESHGRYGSEARTMLQLMLLQRNWANNEIINPGAEATQDIESDHAMVTTSSRWPPAHTHTHNGPLMSICHASMFQQTSVYLHRHKQKHLNYYKHTNSLFVSLCLFSKHCIHTRAQELKLLNTQILPQFSNFNEQSKWLQDWGVSAAWQKLSLETQFSWAKFEHKSCHCDNM